MSFAGIYEITHDGRTIDEPRFVLEEELQAFIMAQPPGTYLVYRVLPDEDEAAEFYGQYILQDGKLAFSPIDPNVEDE